MKKKNPVYMLVVCALVFSFHSAEAKLDRETQDIVKGFLQAEGKAPLPQLAPQIKQAVIRSSTDYVANKKEMTEFNKLMAAATTAQMEMQELVNATLLKAKKNAKNNEELQEEFEKLVDKKKLTELTETYAKNYKEAQNPMNRMGEEILKSKLVANWTANHKNLKIAASEDESDVQTMAWNIISDGPNADKLYVLGTVSIRYQIDKKMKIVDNNHVSVNVVDIVNIDAK